MVKLPRFFINRPFKGHVAYYWWPPKRVREAWDEIPRRLANELPAAIAEAETFNAALDAKRDGIVTTTPEKTKGTLPWLFADFQTSTKYTRRSPKTQAFYDHNFKIVRAWSEKAKHPMVSAIVRAHCLAFYELLCKPHPKTEVVMLRRAKAVMSTLRRVLKHGVDLGAIATNPAEKMELVSPGPREAVWTADDVAAFITAAIEGKRPSLALAVRIAADLGQRRGDVIRLARPAYKEGKFKLRPRKPRRVHEGKRGRWIEIKALPELAAAMAALPEIKEGEAVPTTIVVNENTRRPYVEDTFSHDFREIADKAGLSHLLFMDLRRTAVVNLARASCTVPEIAAITGHSERTVYEILATYLPLDATVADNAIAKLEAWRAGKEKV